MPRSIRIEFAGALYQKISEYGANSHKCQPDPFFETISFLLEPLAWLLSFAVFFDWISWLWTVFEQLFY